MKKILVFVFSILILCSCSKIENEHTIFKNTTLTKLDIWFISCDNDTVRELTNEFNDKYKNVNVNVEIFDKETLANKISEAIKTNSMPNAIFDYSNHAYTYKEFLTPIDEFWQQETLNDINQYLNPYIKFNGKRFMLPVGYDLNFFAINKSLVEEKYLSDEYSINTFEKLLSNSAVEYPFGFYYDDDLLLLFMKNSGAYLTFDKKLCLQNKSFINSIKNIKNYIGKCYINKDKLHYSKDKMFEQFLNKKIAVMPNFTLEDYFKCKEKGMDVKATFMPAKDGVLKKVSANVLGFSIVKSGEIKEIEMSAKYCEYLTQNKRFITSLYKIPARVSQRYFEALPIDPEFKTLIEYGKDNILAPFELSDKTSKTFGILYEYLDKIFKEDMPVKETLEELNTLIYDTNYSIKN